MYTQEIENLWGAKELLTQVVVDNQIRMWDTMEIVDRKNFVKHKSERCIQEIDSVLRLVHKII